MSQRYAHPSEISDDAIREQFAKASEVIFSARSFNIIAYRQICFGDLGWWLPLTRVLPLIGITPQMLRPVFFDLQRDPTKTVKRRFPLNLSWFGLNKNRYRVVGTEWPANVETYDQLGSFVLSERPFQELAKILGKSVKVLREDGGTGDHYHRFTAHPSREIVEATGK